MFSQVCAPMRVNCERIDLDNFKINSSNIHEQLWFFEIVPKCKTKIRWGSKSDLQELPVECICGKKNY